MVRQFTRNLGKGQASRPTAPLIHNPGPFSVRHDGQGSCIIVDGNGLDLLRVRSLVTARQNAEWVAKVLSAAHNVEVNSARNQAALENYPAKKEK